jgi:hypothetical protein
LARRRGENEFQQRPPRRDRTAGDPAADETHPHLLQGPPGETLLSYVRLQPGENRRIAVRRLTVERKAE